MPESERPEWVARVVDVAQEMVVKYPQSTNNKAILWFAATNKRLTDRVAELERELKTCKPMYEARVSYPYDPPHPAEGV